MNKFWEVAKALSATHIYAIFKPLLTLKTEFWMFSNFIRESNIRSIKSQLTCFFLLFILKTVTYTILRILLSSRAKNRG